MFIQQGDWGIEHSAAYLAIYNQQLVTMVERFKSSNTGVRYYSACLVIVVLTQV
jgi:hypothetical protein